MDTTNTNDARTEEVQDIIDRMPTQWTIWITVVTSCIVGIAFCLSFLIKYPDSIEGEITITSAKSPVRLVTSTAGCIHLKAKDKSLVKKGELVAYIDCGIDMKDLPVVDTACAIELQQAGELDFPEDVTLGPLSTAYTDFILALRHNEQIRNSPVFANLQKSLSEHVEATRNVDNNILHEISLLEELKTIRLERFGKDSLLCASGAISSEELFGQWQEVMDAERTLVKARSSHLEKQATINADMLEMAKLHMTREEELSAAYQALESKRNILKGQYQQWRERYLFVAPMNGVLEYLGFWKENTYLKQDTEAFSISVQKNEFVGEMLVPAFGAGKIKSGQMVNIQLHDFPYTEFGYIQGYVASVSEIVQQTIINGNSTPCYKVMVNLPQEIRTNYNRILDVSYETKGTANIITADRKLIERLFDNLKTLKEK